MALSRLPQRLLGHAGACCVGASLLAGQPPARISRCDDESGVDPGTHASSSSLCRQQEVSWKARVERKLEKLKGSSQERLTWHDLHVIGMVPKQWMEALDHNHRNSAILYKYWQRWELSDTSMDFFQWLDEGQGSMLDLPRAPRRLLDEWQVLYLKQDEKALFEVRIDPDTGHFVWAFDGTPVTLPTPASSHLHPETERERAVAALLEPRLQLGMRRDRMLEDCEEKVLRCLAEGAAETPEALAEACQDLVAEGLLCQLRDPFFQERLDPADTPLGHKHLRSMAALPEKLLPGLSWSDVLAAIAHDEGEAMIRAPNRFPRGGARIRQGKALFVVDHFGRLFCMDKVRGILHHSSITRGHCVRVAGSLEIAEGRLATLTPHSGHYNPLQEDIENMVSDWESRGVCFKDVTIRGHFKD